MHQKTKVRIRTHLSDTKNKKNLFRIQYPERVVNVKTYQMKYCAAPSTKYIWESLQSPSAGAMSVPVSTESNAMRTLKLPESQR